MIASMNNFRCGSCIGTDEIDYTHERDATDRLAALTVPWDSCLVSVHSGTPGKAREVFEFRLVQDGLRIDRTKVFPR